LPGQLLTLPFDLLLSLIELRLNRLQSLAIEPVLLGPLQ